MIPDDLKDYRAPDAFQIISEESAGWLLAVALIVGLILDAVQR